MGNITTTSASVSSGSDNNRSGVLFYLHRTWAVYVTDRWTSRQNRSTNHANSTSGVVSESIISDLDSQYSFCSCSQCQRDDGFSSGCDSELFGSGSSIMAPNSEDSTRVGRLMPFGDEIISKEQQRPPIYNPEDYALSLKKWGRKSVNSGSVTLYPSPAALSSSSTNIIADLEYGRSHHHHQSHSFRDYRNPMLMSVGSEMTLRQFGTVTELLNKLKSDLRLAYPSFIQEFVGEPLDGITLLLDLLRAIQLSQSPATGAGCSATTGKIPPSVHRRALLDELACLHCLLTCCRRYGDSTRKLAASSGLFTLALCIMSNVTKSRALALQLLAMSCRSNGFAPVSEALSTLRLRFGEPVRFRFLVGMLMSAGGQGELLAHGLHFLNAFLAAAGGLQQRLYVQAELEQAGFDVGVIKRNICINSPSTEAIFEELDRWERQHVDVEGLTVRLGGAERENEALRDRVLLLERRVQILVEEKGVLVSLEQCLKERCSELQGEVEELKSNCSTVSISKKKDKDSRQEDEGISSSECSPTPEENTQRDSPVFETYTTNCNRQQPLDDDYDEETTIDQVIEELKNIINDAETETYQLTAKCKLDDEGEIVPSNLHPQPPRRTKSLVHLFGTASSDDYVELQQHKELFFENETAYTSEEGSDSLLSASKYQLPRVEGAKPAVRKTPVKQQHSYDGGCNKMVGVDELLRKKSKSLDRIDDGLDAIVDIVLMGDESVSFREGAHAHKKGEMFLPLKRDHSDIPYYFPRIQEKKSSSFLIKRGHANAGLYSGRSSAAKSGEFNFMRGGSGGRILEKVTDLPSGLY